MEPLSSREARIEESREAPPDVDLLCRIRGEYREMPGLRLSIEQASRLWAIDHDVCARLMTALLDAGYLSLDGDGRYLLTHAGY